jgi:hypothetical protein
MTNRRFWRRFKPLVLFLSLTLLSLNFFTGCRVKPELIPLGDCRIVGKVWDGKVVWEVGEGPEKNAFIVTPAFYYKFAWALAQVDILQLELEKCRAKLDKK